MSSSITSPGVQPIETSPLTISISTAPVHSSTFGAATPSHTRILTKETNLLPSSSTSPTREPSNTRKLEYLGGDRQINISPNFIEQDSSVHSPRGVDEEAIESASDFSDYPAGSTVGIKSPTRSTRSHLSWPPVSVTSPKFLDTGARWKRDSQSSDESVVLAKQYGRKTSEVSRQGEGSQGSPLKDFPVLGRYFTASTGRVKSPAADTQGRNLYISARGGEPPTSPNPTVNSIATQSTTTRAEQNVIVSFLPRFLGVVGSPGLEGDPKSLVEPQMHQDEPLKSAFDDTSSEDGNIGENAQIYQATQGISQRPVLVQQNSNAIIGLNEMLRTSGPSMPPTSSPVRSTSKAAQLLGHKVKILDGVIMAPGSADVPVPLVAPEGTRNGEGSLSTPNEKSVAWAQSPDAWGNPTLSLGDGLRSNSVHRSATLPSRRRNIPMPPPTPAPFRYALQPSDPFPDVRSPSAAPVEPLSLYAMETKLQASLVDLERLKTNLISLRKSIDTLRAPPVGKVTGSQRLLRAFRRRTVGGRGGD